MYLPAGAVIPIGELLCPWDSSTGADVRKLFGPRAILHASGRSAFRHALRVLSEKKPIRRVWLPAYACRSVLAPIHACDLEAVLYDVDAELAPRCEGAAPRDDDAFLLIHYFGIPQPAVEIRKFCQASGLPLIEDCAHGLPDPRSTNSLGSMGEAAFFSLRKQLPVPDGGVLALKDAALYIEVNNGGDPHPAAISMKKLLLMTAERVGFAVGLNLIPVKDRLRRLIGSTDGGFALSGPGGASRKPSLLTTRLLTRLNLPERIDRKRSHYSRISRNLAGTPGLSLPIPEAPAGSVPMGFPIWVDDPAMLSQGLRSRGIEAIRWPGEEGLPDVNPQHFPGAHGWQERSVLLPVHEDLSQEQIDRMVDRVRELARNPKTRGA